MSNDFIFEENDSFIIKREIDGQIINFGSFSTMEEAVFACEELDEEGWPIPISESPILENEYGQYISKENNKFIVSREIIGINVIFGRFDSLENAKKFKYKLSEFGWDLSFAKSKNSIKKFNTHYKIIKKIDGEKIQFGSFKNEDEAIIAREKLITENWGLDEEYILNNLGIEKLTGSNHHIGKAGKYKIVYNYDSEGYIFYGFYRYMTSAKRIRDKLIKNNWNKPAANEQLKFISKSDECFKISKSMFGEVKNYGYYYSLNEAIKVRNLLVENDWNLDYLVENGLINKPQFYRHIHENLGKFTIIRKIKGKFIEYGTYDDLGKAIFQRNYLETHNWKFHTDKTSKTKFDKFIFIREDGKYYLNNIINNETRIFGVFDTPLEAIEYRKTCIDNDWDFENISIDECFKLIDEGINPFKESVNDFINDFNEFTFSVRVNKSYKTNEFIINRDYLTSLIPKLNIEDNLNFLVDGNEVHGHLEIIPKLSFDNNKELNKFLKMMRKIDDKSFVRISLNLDKGTYWMNDLSNTKVKFTYSFNETFINKKVIELPRDISSKFIPILSYEKQCFFTLNSFYVEGKLELLFKIKFNDEALIYKLYEIKENDENLDIELIL